MDGADDVLSRPEGFELREPGVHLRRSFGSGRVLELHDHAVNRQGFEVFLDVPSRRDQPHGTDSNVLADGLVDVTVGATRQHRAVLKEHPPDHRIAGVHVLGDGVLHETYGRDDRDLAALHVLYVHYAMRPTEVITMGVRVDDCDHRTGAERCIDEIERGLGRFLGRQRIEDDPSGITFDEGDVGKIEAAHLIDPLGYHLIQAIGHVECGLTLQRRVNAVEPLAFEQVLVAAHVPGHVAGLGLDLLVRRSGDKAFLRFLEVALILEDGTLAQYALEFGGKRRWRLALDVEMLIRGGDCLFAIACSMRHYAWGAGQQGGQCQASEAIDTTG
ncbi:hypothetical protein D9M68_571750 [compost metagenome]